MKRIATLASALALAAPASAAAATTSSSCKAYNPQLCSVTHKTNGPGSPSTGSNGSGTLPFTGIDVALLAIGGGGLLGAGLTVRRLSSRLD